MLTQFPTTPIKYRHRIKMSCPEASASYLGPMLHPGERRLEQDLVRLHPGRENPYNDSDHLVKFEVPWAFQFNLT
jgi:hypothetical protein